MPRSVALVRTAYRWGVQSAQDSASWMSQESRDVAHRCSALLASHACARVCAALACPQRCGEPSLNSSRARNPVECQPGHRDDKAHGAVQMKKFAVFGMSVQDELSTVNTVSDKLRAAENEAVLANSHIRRLWPSYIPWLVGNSPGRGDANHHASADAA